MKRPASNFSTSAGRISLLVSLYQRAKQVLAQVAKFPIAAPPDGYPPSKKTSFRLPRVPILETGLIPTEILCRSLI